MDGFYLNMGKVSAHCISQWGIITAAHLVPCIHADLSLLCVGSPYWGNQCHLPIWFCSEGAVGFHTPVCAARAVHSTAASWSRDGGNRTEGHICFTGVWEEVSLVASRSAVLCVTAGHLDIHALTSKSVSVFLLQCTR